jgi:hypothetical protein
MKGAMKPRRPLSDFIKSQGKHSLTRPRGFQKISFAAPSHESDSSISNEARRVSLVQSRRLQSMAGFFNNLKIFQTMRQFVSTPCLSDCDFVWNAIPRPIDQHRVSPPVSGLKFRTFYDF